MSHDQHRSAGRWRWIPPDASLTGLRQSLNEGSAKEHTTLWVDVVDATPEEILRVGEEFGFHPLALEDVARGGQRPKLDQYDGYQFIVFYGLTTEGERCQSHEVDIFLGKHYMVTFHDSHLPVITETAERWKANVDTMGKRSVGFLLYSLLDALVDGYFPCWTTSPSAPIRWKRRSSSRGSRGSRPKSCNCGVIS